MKKFFSLLMILDFCQCSISQNEPGKVIIDPGLKNSFFDVPHILAQEGSDTVYVDSILIESNDSLNFGERIANSDIQDLNKKHYPFDSCSSYFLGDTLVVEFKHISSNFDKIEIRIIGDEYFPFYVKKDINKEYTALPESLRLNKKIEKRGQKIFGELAIKFIDPETKIEHYFKGPFMCNVD